MNAVCAPFLVTCRQDYESLKQNLTEMKQCKTKTKQNKTKTKQLILCIETQAENRQINVIILRHHNIFAFLHEKNNKTTSF